LLFTKGQGALDHEGGKLVGQNSLVGQIFKKNLEEKGKINTMDGKGRLKPFHLNWKHGILWIPSTINVLPSLGRNN